MNSKIGDRIALGTAQFGMNYGISNVLGKTSFEEVVSILSFAEHRQILMLDTAAAYGDSEEVIGRHAGSQFHVVSKFVDPGDRKFIRKSLQASLERLKRDSLYGYLAHHASTLINDPSYWEELVHLKEDGLVNKIGYSLYTVEELEKLMRFDMIPDLVQVPFNLLDQRFLPYFKELKDKSVEIHIRSVLLQGLLLMDTNNLNSFFNPVKAVIEKLMHRFPSVGERAASLVLFCLQHSAIDKVVIGVNTKDQLENNLLHLQKATLIESDFYADQIPEQILIPSLWPKM